MNIFELSNTLDILKAYFEQPSARTGIKSAFAKAVGIQTSYLSQILSERTHLSMEQALKACDFMNLNDIESDYFLLAVQKSRAGTVDLESYFDQKMADIRSEQNKLSKNLKKTSQLSDEATRIYYSSWHYSAIHVIFSLPHVSQLEQVCELTSIPIQKVKSVTQFLTQQGMLERTSNGYMTRPVHIHLPEDSPLITQHHTNWRIRAMDAIQDNLKENLHYSASFSISKSDAKKIRANLLNVVKENTKVIAPSAEEEVFVTNIDFFKL